MKIKRIAGGVTIALLVLAGVAYHFVFGYVATLSISDSISVLTRQNLLHQIGANVIVYTDSKETIVVDTQLPSLSLLTRSAVDALAITPIANVVITHWHPDHSGGIAAFSGDAVVIAHENGRLRLSAPQEGFGLTKPGSHHQFAARTADGLPNQTVTSERDLASFETGAIRAGALSQCTHRR